MEENKDYKKVELLRCEHCLEFHCDKSELMEQHLSECVANPKNKACLMCNNLEQHNELQDGKPLKYFKCTKNNQILTDFDITLLGAKCFEKRDNKKLVHVNSDDYNKYLESTVKKIQNTIRS